MTRAGVSARKICTAMWPRPPIPITTAVVPGTSDAREPRDRVVRRQRGIAERRGLDGIEIAEGDEQTVGGDEQELGHAAVAPEPAAGTVDLARVLAVVLRRPAARPAHAAAPRSVDGHRIARPPPVDTGSERGDVSGRLVAQRERRSERHEPGRHVHDVQIGVARPGRRDPDDHFARPGSGTATSRSSGGRCHSVSWNARMDPACRSPRVIRHSGSRHPTTGEGSAFCEGLAFSA